MDFRVEMNIFDLIAQIERIEGFKIGVKITQEMFNRKYKPYPWKTPMDGNYTVDEFKKYRLIPALNNYYED